MRLADMTDVSLRARWTRLWARRRRVIIAVITALAVVGAFLMWGPIGLGAGPLTPAFSNGVGWGIAGSRGPLAFALPIANNGAAPAVVDAVQLIGLSGYQSPHVIAMEATSYSACGDGWPTRPVPGGFWGLPCPVKIFGPLIGHVFEPAGKGVVQQQVAFEVAAPPGNKCWVLTNVVIHYHVGIKHYTAAAQDRWAECPHGTSAAQVAAVTAAVG
jgi:hypothetical protein